MTVVVRGLVAKVGDAILLDGLDFRVEAGRVTALVGPSGSGKTTAALALLGEGAELSGHVSVAGTEVVNAGGVTAAAAGMRGAVVAYLPQHPGSALNPARRIGATLRELAALHRGRPVEEALGLAQLPSDRDTARRFPHQFSGGQRQRVALAQTLACRPRVLVLDEPSTGLDVVTKTRLAGELAELAGSGLAILLLSHDHDFVRALADDVVFLRAGRAVPGELSHHVVAVERTRPVGPPKLEVEGLSAFLHSRGRGEVLHDISLALPAGGCVGVVGPSGSGKTTLARCVAGLHERYRGRVLLDGVPLPPLRRRDSTQIRRVQYVWQEVRSSFDERRPVHEQVARTAIRLRGLDVVKAQAETLELLARLGVGERTASRRPAELSGGELQRAAVVRALLAEPDVLVCDEITTALDEVATKAVLDLLVERGPALLWISHDLALVEALADRVVALGAEPTDLLDHINGCGAPTCTNTAPRRSRNPT